jgi:membrane protein involved in colicin uptake
MLNANAVTVAIRIHGVLKNWLIWSSTQKKSTMANWPTRPGAAV